MLMRSALGRLRLVGFAEGTSFLLLLFVAMPLKYMAGQPGMVTVVGSAHGLLWVLYLVALAHAALQRRWRFGMLAAGFVASVLPFGPFVFDGRLRAEEAPA
jgi:integral membrane protein